MLILTRKANEKIVIGNQAEVVVQVLEIRDNRVRLGITAPEGVAIDREEVYLAKREQARR